MIDVDEKEDEDEEKEIGECSEDGGDYEEKRDGSEKEEEEAHAKDEEDDTSANDGAAVPIRGNNSGEGDGTPSPLGEGGL